MHGLRMYVDIPLDISIEVSIELEIEIYRQQSGVTSHVCFGLPASTSDECNEAVTRRGPRPPK